MGWGKKEKKKGEGGRQRTPGSGVGRNASESPGEPPIPRVILKKARLAKPAQPISALGFVVFGFGGFGLASAVKKKKKGEKPESG